MIFIGVIIVIHPPWIVRVKATAEFLLVLKCDSQSIHELIKCWIDCNHGLCIVEVSKAIYPDHALLIMKLRDASAA